MHPSSAHEDAFPRRGTDGRGGLPLALWRDLGKDVDIAAEGSATDTVCESRSWTDAESEAAFEALGDQVIDATRRFLRSKRRTRIQAAIYTVDGYELGRAQVDTLETVFREGEVRMKQLAAQLGVDPSTVTRTTDPLVSRGLVDRFTDPANRRSVVLRCTPAGEKAIAHIIDERRRVMRQTLEPMEPSRRLLLVDLLDEYTTLMESYQASAEGVPDEERQQDPEQCSKV